MCRKSKKYKEVLHSSWIHGLPGERYPPGHHAFRMRASTSSRASKVSCAEQITWLCSPSMRLLRRQTDRSKWKACLECTQCTQCTQCKYTYIVEISRTLFTQLYINITVWFYVNLALRYCLLRFSIYGICWLMYLLHWFPMAANRLYWMLTLGGKRSTTCLRQKDCCLEASPAQSKHLSTWRITYKSIHHLSDALAALARTKEAARCANWKFLFTVGPSGWLAVQNRNSWKQKWSCPECVNVAEHFRTRAQGVRHGETRWDTLRHGETRTRIDRDRLCFCTVSHTGSIGSIGRPGGHGFLDRAQGAGGNKESDPVFHSEGLVESCGVPSDKYNYQTHSKYIKLMSISLHSHSIRWYLYDRTLAGYINPKKVAPLK